MHRFSPIMSLVFPETIGERIEEEMRVREGLEESDYIQKIRSPEYVDGNGIEDYFLPRKVEYIQPAGAVTLQTPTRDHFLTRSIILRPLKKPDISLH